MPVVVPVVSRPRKNRLDEVFDFPQHVSEFGGLITFQHHALLSLPSGLKKAEYAVRGPIAELGEQLKQRLKDGEDLPFPEVGNPQVLGQKPITFHRQVLSLCLNPELIPHAAAIGYPEDVVARAKYFLQAPLGGYSSSKGHPHLRKMVAGWLDRRDGYPGADPETMFLTDGASVGAKVVLQLMIRGKKDGVLIPVPQYPLYSATMTMLGGIAIPYYTDEDANWGFTRETLETAIANFHEEHPEGTIRGLVVINPGNPTGGVLDRGVMEDCLALCAGQRSGTDELAKPMVLIADEVYQENIWCGKNWESFRKVAHEVDSNVELFSLHSVSKGYYGECGLRGGLLQCENIEKSVLSEILKLFSMSLCSNAFGQCMMTSVVNPPKEGEPSFALFAKEKGEIMDSLRERSKLVFDFLNSMEGVSCAEVQGALYAFPKLEVSEEWEKDARKAGYIADMFYCMELLKNTGVVCVPGSGFRQKPESFHLRMTILPSKKQLEGVFERWRVFHADWRSKYF